MYGVGGAVLGAPEPRSATRRNEMTTLLDLPRCSMMPRRFDPPIAHFSLVGARFFEGVPVILAAGLLLPLTPVVSAANRGTGTKASTSTILRRERPVRPYHKAPVRLQQTAVMRR